jgi:hypothetical protein
LGVWCRRGSAADAQAGDAPGEGRSGSWRLAGEARAAVLSPDGEAQRAEQDQASDGQHKTGHDHGGQHL